MSTDYELAVMSKIVYKEKPEHDPQIPDGWYLLHSCVSRNSWDHMFIIFERIVGLRELDKEEQPCGEPWTRPYTHDDPHHGQKIVLVDVEWVIAFRGTVVTSIWNWITNFGLFFNQTPLFSRISIPWDVIIRKELFEKLDNEESELSINVAEQFQKMPDKYSKQLFNYRKEGYGFERRVFTKTFTGHSLGANMAVIRACHEHFQEPIAIDKGPAIVRSVVFDSPGTYPMLTPQEKEWANSENVNGEQNVVSYLSAPNCINTVHNHVGKIRRLYVPHLKGGALNIMNWIFWIYDIVGQIITLLGLHEEIKRGGLILPQIVFFFCSTTYFTGLVHSILRLVLFNHFWLRNQHNISNIVGCFDPHTGETKNLIGFKNGAIVNEWPGFWDHNWSRITRFLTYPLLGINRGLMTGVATILGLTSSEEILEEQSAVGVKYLERNK